MNLVFWKKKQRVPKHRPEHRIVEAFELNGIKYFKFDADVANMPYQRGLEALVFYEQVRMRCTREYLDEVVAAIDKILHQPKIDVFKIHQINVHLKERLTWVIETDTVYNLASVVFFDSTESPYHYDHEYNKKKIASWKKHSTENLDFFLQKPLADYIPFFREQEKNLQIYLEVLNQLSQEHIRYLHAINSIKE